MEQKIELKGERRQWRYLQTGPDTMMLHKLSVSVCVYVWTVHSWIKARAGLHSYQVQIWFNHSRNDCVHCDSVFFLFWTSVQRVRRRASSLLLLVELCTLYYLWRHYSWVCMPEANLLWRLCAKRHTCWWLCHEDIQHVFFGLGLTAWSHSDQT